MILSISLLDEQLKETLREGYNRLQPMQFKKTHSSDPRSTLLQCAEKEKQGAPDQNGGPDGLGTKPYDKTARAAEPL